MNRTEGPGDASLTLAGDVMLGRLVNRDMRREGPAYVWGDTIPLLVGADLAIVNLECVIAGEGVGRPWARWPKRFHFKASPAAIQALSLAGINCVCLANNHVLDYEEPALLEMLTLLESAHILYCGAGRNLADAMCPAMLQAGGLPVGVVAFTDNEPGWAADAGTPGTNWVAVSLHEESLAPVRASIASARKAGAALVIFAMHWGPNMVQRPAPLFREFAHAVIEAGADVFFGHSAHLLQGIEIYQGGPIIYDAGDFVDDYAIDPRLRNDRGLLFRLHLQKQEPARARVKQIELVPVIIAKCQVNRARGQEWTAMAAHMRALSAELGTVLRQDASNLWIDIPA